MAESIEDHLKYEEYMLKFTFSSYDQGANKGNPLLYENFCLHAHNILRFLKVQHHYVHEIYNQVLSLSERRADKDEPRRLKTEDVRKIFALTLKSLYEFKNPENNNIFKAGDRLKAIFPFDAFPCPLRDEITDASKNAEGENVVRFVAGKGVEWEEWRFEKIENPELKV